MKLRTERCAVMEEKQALVEDRAFAEEVIGLEEG